MHFCLISNDLGQKVLTLWLDTTKVDLRLQNTNYTETSVKMIVLPHP